MTSTIPSAETVLAGASARGANVRAMYRLASPPPVSGKPTSEGCINRLVTFGSFRHTPCDSGPTEIRQLSPWSSFSVGQALLQATQDVLATPVTPTSGEFVTLVFATSSWLLWIAISSFTKPPVPGGVVSACEPQQTYRSFHAKLRAQPAKNEDTSSSVLRAWHATAPEVDDEAISEFVSTVLSISFAHSTTASATSP